MSYIYHKVGLILLAYINWIKLDFTRIIKLDTYKIIKNKDKL